MDFAAQTLGIFSCSLLSLLVSPNSMIFPYSSIGSFTVQNSNNRIFNEASEVFRGDASVTWLTLLQMLTPK